MEPQSDYLDRLRPPGSRRSGKRELIVNVFLRQEGHLSADDLVDVIRSEGHTISRATVYRTLQWMVDAGIARKVDFGEGRFRFEHSYRHPRHFHLICKSCNRSFEFLSSDIEALIEEVASARRFASRQSVVQIYGACEECQTGRRQAGSGVATELLFARDALRIAIATERSGLDFYSRAARVAFDSRARRVFKRLAAEEEEHLGKLEVRYRALLAQDSELESRPTFLFFKGAANGLFAAGADELADGTDDKKALMIGIRCERGSHRFFRRYGERFEDSEGKQIFLEFADEERQHLELLIREYRALVQRQTKAKTGKKASKARPRGIESRQSNRRAPRGDGTSSPLTGVIDLRGAVCGASATPVSLRRSPSWRCSPTAEIPRVSVVIRYAAQNHWGQWQLGIVEDSPEVSET